MKGLLGNKTPTKDFPLKKPFLLSSLSKHLVLPERCHSTQPCFSISPCVCPLLSLPWAYGLLEGRVGVCLLAALCSAPGTVRGADLGAQPFPSASVHRVVSSP